MLEDFRVVSKGYIPVWRKRTKRKRAADAAMALASIAGLVLVWTPWRGHEDLRTAISVQLANGDPAAIALFAFMALVLALMAQRLWRADRKPSAGLMSAEVVALGLLAVTDPNSIDHLLVFAAVALSSAAWLVVLAIDLDDRLLHTAALCGLASFALVPSSLGLSERALITSCLLGMDLMFFRHFD